MRNVFPLVILTALILACTPVAPVPTPDAAVQAEIQALEDEIRKLRESPSGLQRQSGGGEASQMPDICDRFPALQKEVLEALNLGRCRLAVYSELFRIERLYLDSQPTTTPLKARDFAGLVNLTELGIQFDDSCGQWDDIAFTESVVAELPSLVHFDLALRRVELEPTASSAEEIADTVFLAINNWRETEHTSKESELNGDYMYAQIVGPGGSVQVRIDQRDDLLPCRNPTSRQTPEAGV